MPSFSASNDSFLPAFSFSLFWYLMPVAQRRPASKQEAGNITSNGDEGWGGKGKSARDGNPDGRKERPANWADYPITGGREGKIPPDPVIMLVIPSASAHTGASSS